MPTFNRVAATRAASASAATHPDGDLLARAARHDPTAHRALVVRHYAGIFGFLMRRLHDARLCEEVTSEVFFEVWRGATNYRGESSVRSWLYEIACCKGLLAVRRRAQEAARVSQRSNQGR